LRFLNQEQRLDCNDPDYYWEQSNTELIIFLLNRNSQASSKAGYSVLNLLNLNKSMF